MLLMLASGYGQAQNSQTLQPDAHQLLVDGSLSNEEAAARPYVFNNMEEALREAEREDSATIFIRPWVYWIDDPDDPEIRTGKDGREPFGMTVKARWLRLVGVGQEPSDVVLASQRGQTQGAVGNFTMFDFHTDELQVENLTMGNYCNVDLDYKLLPQLSRKKRNEAITQAHVGYVHGRTLTARRVRFVSRLNLNPLNGAKKSLYEYCHFECTDDALNGGNAVYRHCDFDLYGQKPFWSTFGRGPLLEDCDFNVRSHNSEMYFCKQGGPVTLVDCRYHAPSDSIYIGWTAYPQRWLRCYQRNFTLNGRPYTIGHRQAENTVVLDSIIKGKIASPLHLDISQHEATMQVGGQPLQLSAPSGGKTEWHIPAPHCTVASLSAIKGDTMAVSLTCDDFDDDYVFPVVAISGGAVAACMVTVKAPPLPPPAFKKKPEIAIKNGVAQLDYELNLAEGLRDESRIVWMLQETEGCSPVRVADSNDGPTRQWRLSPSSQGKWLQAWIWPKHQRSEHGEKQIVSTARLISCSDISSNYELDTDFSDISPAWSKSLAPDTWQADGYKPADTQEFDWNFDPQRPMWEYGEGYNGAVGRGLLQAQRGARLMYTPAVGRKYGDMTLTLLVDPTKTAGQGFGSATGQYMDVCLKFDTSTLTGYGLRIIRTTKHAKAVDFLLVEYEYGRVKPLTEPISATCYRTGCTIAISYQTTGSGTTLQAHVSTTTPQPADSTLPHEVRLAAQVPALDFGGIHIQHTGSCGESTTMLHRLHVEWPQ